ncbi:(E2-independent) E3 ubiquitin-conjugating enzyme FATS isoform X2 [Narcine bancroftii]|uniref:(E2-independent) E3 ubiquitin-conjugating enzyme FATS isoform X2 n=1 Tax=Narcine bancroftii TaxID=1343680 RepID=UPI003831F1C8
MSDFWDLMMSQVKILPSRSFMANSILENISLKPQKTQRGVTGDFKIRAAPPASQTPSMLELSSECIAHTAWPNNQNVKDRLGFRERIDQYYSGTTKSMSTLNYSEKPFTTYALRTQYSPGYRTTNINIDFGARIEKVHIKDSSVHRKENITLVVSDTVRYRQLPKRSNVALYILNGKRDNYISTLHCIENLKMNDAFSSFPIQNMKNKLRTKDEDQVIQGFNEEAEHSLEHYFSMTRPLFREPKSEHSKCEGFQESLRYPHTLANNTSHTVLPTMPALENILEATVRCRKDKTLTKSRNGFSSITITARRLMSPANKLSKASVRASTHKKNATQHEKLVKVLKNFMTSAEGIVHIHSHTDNINEFPFNGYTVTEESSQSQSMLCSTGDKVSSLKIDSKHHETSPPNNNEEKTHVPTQQFHPAISFVHLIVTPQFFNSTYYLDKSRLVDLYSLTNDRQPKLIQKSSLTLKLSCASSKLSADGGDGMFNLISFKQEVGYIILDKKSSDIFCKGRDITRQTSSVVQKVSKTAYQYNGDSPFGGKETLSSSKRSTILFISLSNMNKGRNYFTTEQKYKPHHCEVYPFCNLIRESADTEFSNSHVDLMGKRKHSLKQIREKSALSMPAKSTGSFTENQVEDTETNQLELATEREKTLLEELTLREALQLYKPDFIFRSQKRLQELEDKSKQRRVQLHECTLQQRKRALVQSTPLPSPFKKRQCTIPHPLSDNLYKPKERMIPEKEMQMRSKRIYNKLPEVKKKKEEEKKKVISQTNRLRAMVYKKLLDKILQKQ